MNMKTILCSEEKLCNARKRTVKISFMCYLYFKNSMRVVCFNFVLSKVCAHYEHPAMARSWIMDDGVCQW
jgi:hypothetical protein